MVVYKKRVDANQTEITQQARDLGISVQLLHAVGKDCPDILCGYAGINILAEIKTDNGKLSEGQEKFQNEWEGQVCTIRNIDDLVTEFFRYSYTLYSTIELLNLLSKYQNTLDNVETQTG